LSHSVSPLIFLFMFDRIYLWSLLALRCLYWEVFDHYLNFFFCWPIQAFSFFFINFVRLQILGMYHFF
jgi:hypothetical protein